MGRAGWLFAGLFAVLGLWHAANLVRPATLRLDGDGFALTDPIRRRWRREWSECSAFITWGSFGLRKRPVMVMYSSGRYDRALLRFLNILLSGGDESISAGFGRLSATRLAALMNEYRDSVVGPDESSAAEFAELVGPEPRPRSRLSKIMWGLVFWLAMASFGGAYVTFRLGGPATLWIALAVACAAFFIAWTFKD